MIPAHERVPSVNALVMVSHERVRLINAGNQLIVDVKTVLLLEAEPHDSEKANNKCQKLVLLEKAACASPPPPPPEEERS